MSDGFTATMSATGIKVIALAIVWVLLVVGAYLVVRWLFQRPAQWSIIARYITIGMVAMIVMVIGISFMSATSSKIITNLFIPYILCTLALHSLILAIDRYLTNRYHAIVSRKRLLIITTILYSVMLAVIIVIGKFDMPTITTIASMCVYYLMRIAIVGILFLDVMSGRCNHNFFDDTDNDDEGGITSKISTKDSSNEYPVTSSDNPFEIR